MREITVWMRVNGKRSNYSEKGTLLDFANEVVLAINRDPEQQARVRERNQRRYGHQCQVVNDALEEGPLCEQVGFREKDSVAGEIHKLGADAALRETMAIYNMLRKPLKTRQLHEITKCV